ncbi:hypothetical protein [Naasia aerilata]|uniref:hypothetical protein n=1 Tax=Naasia aerilata TaxID=1162966 RepID=UPI0025739046|nr:hypothetical protein [Naasia aerilata]
MPGTAAWRTPAPTTAACQAASATASGASGYGSRLQVSAEASTAELHAVATGSSTTPSSCAGWGHQPLRRPKLTAVSGWATTGPSAPDTAADAARSQPSETRSPASSTPTRPPCAAPSPALR